MKLKLMLAATTVAFMTTGAFAGGDRSGSFNGASGHITTGDVTVVKTDGGYEIRLAGNFNFDGAPDPRIGFGKGGKFAKGTDFEPLQNDVGAQVYKVPADLNPAEFESIYVWCRQYSVPLGKAILSN